MVDGFGCLRVIVACLLLFPFVFLIFDGTARSCMALICDRVQVIFVFTVWLSLGHVYCELNPLMVCSLRLFDAAIAFDYRRDFKCYEPQVIGNRSKRSQPRSMERRKKWWS